MKCAIAKKALALLVCIPVLISISCIAPARGTLQYPVFHKGMSYVSWSQDSFSKPTSDESLRAMADIGTNCVAIIPTWYQDEYNSTEISPTERTPSDSSVRHAIQKAHEYGMSVMLKPHIDLNNQRDCNRSDIGFQNEGDWQRWFGNYERFITHYAKIAQGENAEFFCVGTELSFAATKTDSWKNIVIPAVRKNFSGQITYAANWDEYDSVKFWDGLDYAGIDAYFPLAKSSSPTPQEIRSGWRKWANDIGAWQKKINKPVLFTECGYPSADTAAMKPWEEAVAGKANPAVQAECYKATLETVWEKPWFFGVYWWTWSTHAGAGGPSNRGFTPQNKPAMDYLKEWYGKLVDKHLLYGGESLGRDTELDERLKLQALESGSRSIAGKKGVTITSEMASKEKRDLPRIRF